jgi:hypothetical protein
VRYWFKPSDKRNEALDRRVYALAALHSRPVPWEVLLRAEPTEPPPPSPPEGGGPPAPSSPTSALPAPASRFERWAHPIQDEMTAFSVKSMMVRDEKKKLRGRSGLFTLAETETLSLTGALRYWSN